MIKIRDFLYNRASGILEQTNNNRKYFTGSKYKKTDVIYNPVFMEPDHIGSAVRTNKLKIIISRYRKENNMSEDINTPNNGEELDNIIILNDENGNEVKFEFLDLMEYEGEEYIILLPTEEGEDNDEVVILKVEDVEDDPDMETYVSIDDEDTLNAVFEMFKEKFKDEFNFIDE